MVLPGRFARLSPPGSAHPDVRFVHRPDRAGLDQLDDAPVVVGGVDLRAHLGGDLGLGGGLANDAGFPDVVRQRLLAVDVLAQLQGRQGGEGVGVLARAHDDRVELAGVVVELAKVTQAPGVRVLDGRSLDGRIVHVAERDDVLAGNSGQIGRTPAAGADDGDVELLVQVPPADDRGRKHGAHRRARNSPAELAARRSPHRRGRRGFAHGRGPLGKHPRSIGSSIRGVSRARCGHPLRW